MKAILFSIWKALLFASALAAASAASSPCHICGGQFLGIPDGVLVSLDGESTVCQVLATANGLSPAICVFSRAFEGLTCEEVNGQVIDDEFCSLLPVIIGDECGCGLVPSPAPFLLPTITPFSPPTTPPFTGFATAIIEFLEGLIATIKALFGLE